MSYLELNLLPSSSELLSMKSSWSESPPWPEHRPWCLPEQEVPPGHAEHAGPGLYITSPTWGGSVTNQRPVLRLTDQSEASIAAHWPIRGQYCGSLTNQRPVLRLTGQLETASPCCPRARSHRRSTWRSGAPCPGCRRWSARSLRGWRWTRPSGCSDPCRACTWATQSRD